MQKENQDIESHFSIFTENVQQSLRYDELVLEWNREMATRKTAREREREIEM